MNHLTVVIGEHTKGDYNVCDVCGHRTALIMAPSYWSVDSEPFKEDEEDESIEDTVEVSEELSAHYCPECGKITSLSFNG